MSRNLRIWKSHKKSPEQEELSPKDTIGKIADKDRRAGGTDKEEGDTQKEFENEGKLSKKFKPS